MRRWWSEPLVHFLWIGAALFAVDLLLPARVETASRRIVLTQAQVDQLITGFASTWQRPPSQAELDALVDDLVKDEIDAREALAMGLDRDDSVIRRRLRQKFEYLTEDTLAGTRPPSDAELQAWLESHAAIFAVEAQVALRQICFTREKHGDAAEADARRALATLTDGASGADPLQLGDPSLLPPELELCARGELARQFGDAFANAVVALAPGSWTGPVASAFGFHLVRVSSRVDARGPALAEVRAAVERDWRAAQRAESRAAFDRALRARYEIVVEPKR